MDQENRTIKNSGTNNTMQFELRGLIWLTGIK